MHLSRDVAIAFYSGFREMSPIQSAAIEPIFSGSDTVIVSGTGSGKTEAAVAPLCDRLVRDRAKGVCSQLLYVTPMKALANDLVRRLGPPMERLGLTIRVRHGDSRDPDAAAADLIITTPESLDVMISTGGARFADVRVVVLDEAHQLLNNQRGLQLASLLRRVERRAVKPLQVVALSATMASPQTLWEFLRPHYPFSGVTVIEGGKTRQIEAVVRTLGHLSELPSIARALFADQPRKVLVFANSRRTCDSLGSVIGDALPAAKVFVHHSSLSPEARLENERRFVDTRQALCLSTSTLELGIDVGDIDLVVLYGIPSSLESFIQRIGRGNRRGATSRVICLVPPDSERPTLEAFLFLSLIRMGRSGNWSDCGAMRLYGAVTQQILSIVRENAGGFVRLADLAELFAPWTHLDRAAIDAIADALVSQGYCTRHDFKNRIGADEGFHVLEALRMLWGNFPSSASQISLKAHGRSVGSVPATNLRQIKVGTRLRFAGRRWQVLSVGSDAVHIIEDRGSGPCVDLSYRGTAPALDPVVLESCLEMLTTGTVAPGDIAKRDQERLVERAEALGKLLSPAQTPYSASSAGYAYITFGGRITNAVVAAWSGNPDAAVDELAIRSAQPIPFHSLPSDPQALEGLAHDALSRSQDATLYQNLLPDTFRRDEIVQAWTHPAVTARALRRLQSAMLSPSGSAIEAGALLQ